MTNNWPALSQCALFAGIPQEDYGAVLACLDGSVRTLARKETVFAAGTEDFALGVVLEGSVDIVQEDFWGNQGLLARLSSGGIFAESFVLAQMPRLPVSVTAGQDTTILLLDYRRILRSCGKDCTFHERLVENLLSVLARKNIALTEKMELVTRRTLREKLLAYLSAQAKAAASSHFTIPYDRQALADYLAVDRSALSRALSEMQREGLLRYHKNSFELL